MSAGTISRSTSAMICSIDSPFAGGDAEVGFQIAGLDLRQHRQVFDALEVVGDPVDQFVTEATKLFLAHVA